MQGKGSSNPSGNRPTDEAIAESITPTQKPITIEDIWRIIDQLMNPSPYEPAPYSPRRTVDSWAGLVPMGDTGGWLPYNYSGSQPAPYDELQNGRQKVGPNSAYNFIDPYQAQELSNAYDSMAYHMTMGNSIVTPQEQDWVNARNTWQDVVSPPPPNVDWNTYQPAIRAPQSDYR